MEEQLRQWFLDWINTVVYLPDAILEKEWYWQGYDEGLRMSFLRVQEELRSLDSELALLRRQTGKGFTSAQTILSGYHQAYWELRLIYAAVDNQLADRIPKEKEWSLRDILYHLIETEWAFYGLFRYTFRYAGTKPEWPQGKAPESFMTEHFEIEGQFRESIFTGDITTMLGFYDQLHQRVLLGLKEFPDGRLSDPIFFWEPQPMPARFRLIRFESHLHQHTIQAEKTLGQLKVNTTEIKHLLRNCAQTFAEVEAGLVFFPDDAGDLIRKRLDSLQKLSGAVRLILQ
ncbi:MAG: hypothetical protein CVU39_01645 [Chloroflexi bacterium HGW-Chloroflexi-10]|nr:MAG: hypothetical protein CVU39_01645 [Chloroflexi bacterium HGW-Chloroflexi-10]